ncbi:hypothetical protein HC752_05995 [Vibrio sp. S9_S30]|uniref:hypothetical protein n=1 Tax=Vibrio sp. S9_S30 TaxID=2720226 RepID=UPI00168007AC|nr:hypothetical protein [Vibrio sp. S9_S30]MBD1556481.1 hypothetical protein [Vibrio sp. S9_S30]
MNNGRMNIIKTRSIVIVLLTVLVLIQLWVGIVGDNVTTRFEDYREMEASGIVEQGWLPAFLPQSAINIQEKHDLDTNEVMATFDYDPQDTGSVQESCELMSETEQSTRYSCSHGESDAFIELRKEGTGTFSSRPKVDDKPT